MPLSYPPNHQTTSTKEKLSNTPKDMPDRGGPKPEYQTTSSQVPLSRTENPVAAFGAHPNQGSVQSTSTQASLSRSASAPYENLNATKPQVPYKGSKKK
jgi:hypothetical protein